MRKSLGNLPSQPYDDAADSLPGSLPTPRMRPRVLALDSAFFESPCNPCSVLDSPAKFPHSARYSKSVLFTQTSDEGEDHRPEPRRQSSAITTEFVNRLISNLRRLEPNYVIPKVGNDDQSLQLFVAQLCASLLHWVAQMKSGEGRLDDEVESLRRTLNAKELHLSEVAQGLIDDRKLLAREKDEFRIEKLGLEEMKSAYFQDRETLQKQKDEVERQTVTMEEALSRQKEEKKEEIRRNLLVARLQSSLKQQQLALQREIDEFAEAKKHKETALRDLDSQLQEKETRLSHLQSEISRFDEAKTRRINSSPEKTQHIATLQAQLEMDKTRYQMQSEQSQLEMQRAELITEELKFNDAFSKRISRLGKLGEELEVRGIDLARARDRLDMERGDFESQIMSLGDQLKGSEEQVTQLHLQLRATQTLLEETQDALQSLKLQERLKVVSSSQLHAEVSEKEQELVLRERELEVKVAAVGKKEENLKRKMGELEGLEDSLKAAQEALDLMKKESTAGGQFIRVKEQDLLKREALLKLQLGKLQNDRHALAKDRAAFDQLSKASNKQVPLGQNQANKAEQERTASMSSNIDSELQEARLKMKSESDALDRDKEKVRDLVQMMEAEGAKLQQKEEQLRQLSKQLTAREQQLYEREKSLRKKEFRLSDHKAEREALKLRTPNEDRELFDPDELLSCSLTASPGEPHSLETSPK